MSNTAIEKSKTHIPRDKKEMQQQARLQSLCVEAIERDDGSLVISMMLQAGGFGARDLSGTRLTSLPCAIDAFPFWDSNPTCTYQPCPRRCTTKATLNSQDIDRLQKIFTAPHTWLKYERMSIAICAVAGGISTPTSRDKEMYLGLLIRSPQSGNVCKKRV